MFFEFATATRIIFGNGVLAQAGVLAAEMGRRALVVIGSTATRASPLIEQLAACGVESSVFSVLGEPTIEVACAGTERARQDRCDVVVGFGGGSVLDAAKAVAALLSNEGEPLDYLEIVGRGRPLANPSAPYMAIPTTAGTGAEVTRNAVLASPQHRLKVSLRGPYMLPRLALVDPELTHSLPPKLTASTGLDALTQLVEPFVSNKANPLTDAFCREGIGRAARSLRRACEHGDDAAAREDMSLASLLGGLALANAKLGVVHGLAGVVGGMFPAPHGAVCACLLPHVMAANVQALRLRQPGSLALRRYDEIGQLLTGNVAAGAVDAIVWVRELCEALQILSLSAYGLTEQDFPLLVEKAQTASSTQGNPVQLAEAELGEVLAQAL
ncbi:MAG: iron-containing alcohol dehydrogenase [Thermoflexales bacterium]|nr:iron-containing alcohol dehydrogenase [Thermoflexales bacterium]